MTKLRTRVALATRIYAPEPAAASFRLDAVAQALVGQGCSVSVFTTTPPRGLGGESGGRQRRRGWSDQVSAKRPLRESDVEVRRWPALRDKTGYLRGYLPYLSFDLPLFFRLLLSKVPDAILVEPPPTTGAVVRIVAAVRRTPYVWYAADLWSDATRAAGAPRFVSGILERVEKFAIRGAAGNIAVSQGVAARVQELGGRNVKVIPNGIDVGVYGPDAEASAGLDLESLGITGQYLIYGGTASEWQGAEIFIDAMRHLLSENPNLQLVYVGQGSHWQEIKERAAALNRETGWDTVVVLPMAPPQDAARLLAGAEAALVSIVPDKGYDVAYPTKILAALSAGTPVLYAGKGPAVADLRESKLGRAASYDAADIAANLRILLRAEPDAEQPARLHAWARDHRSLQAMGRQVADFVHSIGRKTRR